ncbi:protein argonaute [Fervidobacterium islandicum]|uniref:protein argonaute n=1 Tax=Fervidobacterium islandicum TaxID=2423 RepID=UPI003A6F6C48
MERLVNPNGYAIPMNIFRLKIPPRVKRIYYYNPHTDPELFAENLSRVNHLHFTSSNDLVWVEIPDINVAILPLEVSKYELDKKEIIENDERLFVKTANAYISKMFSENGYIKVFKRNEFIYPSAAGSLLNGQINYHIAYTFRTVKLNNDWYITILPSFKFFSNAPAVSSKATGSLVFNIRSGKTFQVLGVGENKLSILYNNNIVDVKDLQAYYFVYTSSDAERLGLLSEMQRLYKEKLNEEIKKLDSLYFLNSVAEMGVRYTAKSKDVLQDFYYFQFKDGTSNRVNDIFKLHPIHTEDSITFALFFKSQEHASELKDRIKTLFHPSGLMTKALFNLGIRKIEFLRNPKDGSHVFTYNDKNFVPDVIPNLCDGTKKVVALIFLERFYGNILPIISNFPQGMILMPVLNKTIIESKVYTINSFAYKIVNFLNQDTMMYYLKIEPGTLFVGVDLAHNITQARSDVIFSAVDFLGKVVKIAVKKGVPLTEKADVLFVEEQIQKSIEKYRSKFGKYPKRLIFFRDGRFIESVTDLEDVLSSKVGEYALIEVKKDTLYNSHYSVQDKVIKLSENMYVYFPKSYLGQKGIEIGVFTNRTSLNNDELAKLTYMSTLLHHPSPYMSIKLPYPLYINDKISAVGGEWKFYVPYFV